MSNGKKCNGCGVSLTPDNTIHKIICPTVPKCKECGVRIDLWGIPHSQGCSSNLIKSNRTAFCNI